jgi:hypothetical protein
MCTRACGREIVWSRSAYSVMSDESGLCGLAGHAVPGLDGCAVVRALIIERADAGNQHLLALSVAAMTASNCGVIPVTST